MLANYLSAQQLIIDRLKIELGDRVRDVLGTADLAGVIEQAQITPAIHVIYWGDRLGADIDRHAAMMVYQQWLTVIAIRSAAGQKSGTGAREEAGPIISATIEALTGWAPSVEHQAMKRISVPKPMYSPGGYAYFPLGFETRINTGAPRQ